MFIFVIQMLQKMEQNSHETTTLFLAFSVVLHLMLLLLIYPQLYIPTTQQIVFTIPPPSLPRVRYLKLWFTRLWTLASLIFYAPCTIRSLPYRVRSTPSSLHS
jgi:hypothetical protein